MTINPWERRRAEQFAALLDSDDPAHLHSTETGSSLGAAPAAAPPTASSQASQETPSDAAVELAAMLATSERLGGLGDQVHRATEPDADWRGATRRRLMAIAADEGIGVTARASARARVPDTGVPPVHEELFSRRPRGGRRVAVVAALLGGTVAVSGVSAASGDALPGDALYGVKRSTERAQLALAGDDMSKAQLHFEFASTRLTEARELAGHPEASAEAIDAAYSDILDGAALFHGLAAEQGDTAALDYVDLFVNDQRPKIEELTNATSGAGADAAQNLWDMLGEAGHRSLALRQALACEAPVQETDRLGPLPGQCEIGDERVEAPGGQGPAAPSDPGTENAGGHGEPEHGTEDPAVEDSERVEDDSDAETPADEKDADAADENEPAADVTEDDGTEDDDAKSSALVDELNQVLSKLLG
ncbi:DUF5667 domain-containing protein [Salininema proteolyticum]|uniref:DUF5667 domain-containing protein n=1 Tax=Salininema proteolyticum TaxID=1607685 RepID=A0ABV8U2A4_9ACTN